MWTSLLNTLGLAWWVEIVTDSPHCTYYFGPFASAADAEMAKPGYLEDLEKEGAQNIKVVVKRDKPANLTIFDERADMGGRGGPSPVFSGQT